MGSSHDGPQVVVVAAAHARRDRGVVNPPPVLAHLVATAADGDPDAPAVRSSDGDLTYGQLARRVDDLAALFQQIGIARGDRVGLFRHKSVASFVAVHAILRAGAAYVPIDPFAPATHVAEVVRNCGIEIVATEQRLATTMSEVCRRDTGLRALVGLEESLGRFESLPDAAVAGSTPNTPDLTADDLAYVIYTSGSTGTPKGIVHTHGSAMAYARQAAAVYGVRPDDRLANSAPFHFDISTFELFAGPVARASTLVIPEPYLKMPASLSQLVSDDRSTFWYSVPYLLGELLARGALERRDLSSLRWVLFGGEVMQPDVLRSLMELLPNARFSNSYGPAEVNQCSYYHLDGPPEPGETIPIGMELPETRVIVVGDDGTEAPTGEPGELMVSGPTVMDRYWARPDLDASVFLERAQPDGTMRRWYRTGDRGRRRADGMLEFLGRRDNLVKIRGNRVELEGIELVLGEVDGIKDAVVGIVDHDGRQLMVAAVVLHDGGGPTPREILAQAGSELPPYAVPDQVIVLSSTEIALTASGKLDRREIRQRLPELAVVAPPAP